MDRLSKSAPPPLPEAHFLQCQICGLEYDDITSLNLWWEADDRDKHDSDISPVILVCKSKKCLRVIKEHERLYIEMPWSQGGPGKFMLICGPCPLRKGSMCTHPDLLANGGAGLEVFYTPLFDGPVHIQQADGWSGYVSLSPMTGCSGLSQKDSP